MKTRIRIHNILLISSLLFCFIISICMYNNKKEQSYYNNARIVLRSDINLIENNRFDELMHTVYICDLQGKIVFSNNSEYTEGISLNLDEIIQSDNHFISTNKNIVKLVFPIADNNTLKYMAVFTLNKNSLLPMPEYITDIFIILPIIIWCIFAVILFIINSYYLNKKVLKQINTITASANDIINGNLKKTIIQEADKEKLSTEIDTLCYSFELMRDELEEKSRKENELKQAQKELICCMSHDLRTPITTIKAHAEAIRDGLGKTKEKQDKYISTIINKSDILTKMIGDLLDNSNAECNQLAINKKEFYLCDWFLKITKEIEIYCHKFNCSFSYGIPDENLLIYADIDRINQVVYNLIENAIKYNSKDSKRIIFNCTINKPLKRVYFSVVDNGNGISMSDVAFVFDKFYRAEKSRSMQIPGSGLGLSICKYIVEAHNGEISIKSDLNKGTEFEFYLLYE